MVEGFNVTILKKDIHTLRPGEWLNDEVINFYGNLILARSKESTTLPKIHVFSTFFYKTLSEQGYDKVRRWTKKVSTGVQRLPSYPALAMWKFQEMHLN